MGGGVAPVAAVRVRGVAVRLDTARVRALETRWTWSKLYVVQKPKILISRVGIENDRSSLEEQSIRDVRLMPGTCQRYSSSPECDEGRP